MALLLGWSYYQVRIQTNMANYFKFFFLKPYCQFILMMLSLKTQNKQKSKPTLRKELKNYDFDYVDQHPPIFITLSVDEI